MKKIVSPKANISHDWNYLVKSTPLAPFVLAYRSNVFLPSVFLGKKKKKMVFFYFGTNTG